jgi:hypothetical protein
MSDELIITMAIVAAALVALVVSSVVTEYLLVKAWLRRQRKMDQWLSRIG